MTSAIPLVGAILIGGTGVVLLSAAFVQAAKLKRGEEQ